ncbi:membrane protein [Bacteroidia bacterium]|nr:membrane protein [Bacteroidia bacterium]
MLGTIINTGAVVVGGAIGLLANRHFPERYAKICFLAIGLFTMVLGVQMALQLNEPLVAVLALVVGGLCGEWLQLDIRVNGLSETLKKKFRIGNVHFTEGLLTAFLLFCMGSMSVLGPIEEGLTGEVSNLLKIKSLMDGISALILASALGVGVLVSAVPLLVYQGAITLLAHYAGANIPDFYITEISGVGGILLIGISLNILEIKRLPVLNLLLSLVFVCLFLWVKLCVAG